MSAEGRAWPNRAATFIPAVIALGLAVLYTTGALVKVSQVAADGFSASQTLQVTPIQQLLAIGVSYLASPESLLQMTGAAVFIVGGASVLAYRHDQRDARRRESMLTEAAYVDAVGDSPVREIALAVGAVIALIFVVLTSPPSVAVAFAVVMPATFALLAWRKWPRRRMYITVYVVTIGFATVTRGLAYPTHLPPVTVMTNSRDVSGVLLVSTEGAVTVGLPGCSIETIPASEARSVIVGSAKRRTPHTVGELILGMGSKPHRRSARCSP